MGIVRAPQKCYFTDLSAIDMGGEQDCIDYYVEIEGKKVHFKLKGDFDWESSEFIKQNLTELRGEIFNFRWPLNSVYINETEVKRILAESDRPRTPKDKIDNLFLELCKLPSNDGERVMINKLVYEPCFYARLYFKNHEECNFYLRTLDEMGLIKAITSDSKHVLAFIQTFKGLNYQIELAESNLYSNNCFIAMSFGEDMSEIRSAIKEAVVETGFIPILIDEIQIDAEQTINDGIIANIKKAKFCISDFTQQKDGVYFEAGYALGRGLKVIYTCRDDWFKQSHFDTNHFPHIIYNNCFELKQKLKIKIEAWIK